MRHRFLPAGTAAASAGLPRSIPTPGLGRLALTTALVCGSLALTALPASAVSALASSQLAASTEGWTKVTNGTPWTMRIASLEPNKARCIVRRWPIKHAEVDDIGRRSGDGRMACRWQELSGFSTSPGDFEVDAFRFSDREFVLVNRTYGSNEYVKIGDYSVILCTAIVVRDGWKLTPKPWCRGVVNPA